MKKFLLAVILLLIFSSVGSAEPARNLATSVDALCWKYFATLDKDDDIFFSPYGIHAALSIVANGASGDTLKEILNALEADNVDALNDEHKRFLAAAKKNYRDGNLFAESNLLLINKKLVKGGLDEKFQRVLTDVYNSEVRKAPFTNSFDDAEAKKITRWVSEKTDGFIPNYYPLLLTNSLTDLLNVICFKGKWAIPFKTSDTTHKDFTNRAGEKSTVDMMSKVFKDAIVYKADDKFKGIRLPYSAGAEMYLILPVDDNALNVAELWSNETFSYRADFLDGLKNSYPFDGDVVVNLPKFGMSFQVVLSENLQEIGINRAFTDNAELFNIVKGMPLKINTAMHCARIEVDEEGTKAAAVTEITMVETTAMPNPQPPRKVYFIADHPFLFVIRDVESNVTLFAGVANKI